MEDQSILGKNTPHEDYAYLNDLVKAVCIDGESFDKYEKMVVKIFGDEICENLKHFIEELSRSAERKGFSNSSLISLGYLGKNAGLSQKTLDAVIKHYQEAFQRPEPRSFEPEPVPAQQPAYTSNPPQPTKGGKVTEELRRWLKLTTICYGAALAISLIDAIYIISFFRRMNAGIRVVYPTSFWLAQFLPPTLSLLGLLFIRSKWLLYVEDGNCRFFKGVGLWGCLLGWVCLPFFPHTYCFISTVTIALFGLTYLFILGAYIFRYKMARHVKNMGS